MDNKSTRKLILAAFFTMGVSSASLAGGAGFDGSVVTNVYEYLAAHGCPSAAFGLVSCSYYHSFPDYRCNRGAQRHGKKQATGRAPDGHGKTGEELN